MKPKWRQVCIKTNSGKLWEKHCCGECKEHCIIWVPIEHLPPTNCEEVKKLQTDNGWK